MAIAKLLHEGATIKQLKNVIRYNTVAKEYLNSPDNPRLLQVLSNLGIIDISDPQAYQDFMDMFVEEIKLNKSQSTNQRQNKLYAHEVISFEDNDNARFSQNELAKISIELLSHLYDMQNTPYLIYPQQDSGRLHFHFIRGQHSSNGVYQRVKNSKRKMRVACEAIERKYQLTLTGNNVSNEIRPANDPMAKVVKNCQLEAKYQHLKKLSAAKGQDTPLTKIKRKSYDLLMEESYQSEAEMAEHTVYKQVKQSLSEKTQVNQKLETVKQTIFNLYKSTNDEVDFIEQLDKKKITVEILKHAKSGKNKGIVFHYQGETMSGGKISSSMTLGKIKTRFPNFIHTLEKPPSLRATFKQQRKMLDFQIANINRYYKQKRNNTNGDILIYFGKKNIDARPYNYNIVLSSDKSSIRFGSSTNTYDLTLSINVALENGWQGATLTRPSPAFLKKMMKAAYEQDPKLLFFVQPDTDNQLSYADLKEIKSPLTIDELKTALTNQLINQTDIATVQQDLIKKLELDKNNHANLGYANALKSGFVLAQLEKKTAEQLTHYYHHHSFQPINEKTISTTANNPVHIKTRASFLEDIKKEIKTARYTSLHKSSNGKDKSSKNNLRYR
ncbi:hypothetical protein GLP30_04930 [Photobacterium phosphoreum]|uniref:MobA/VirD2-like nuclease domain-containing protein n=1 Tax=Photobacterium phosphoreum TaxID=659 RepID=A0AAW4ZVX9_PHOPO|nr:hypothetical protein [Photobacterium phosphoreum]MCD9490172.1 hypothetical protein [Photobacterium phosphoreum]MCF2189438.1 hypothetical protein [Photobacterium phosphoreum]MCF2301224.1 hypothetical protein [Photobacterium phosphoreum]